MIIPQVLPDKPSMGAAAARAAAGALQAAIADRGAANLILATGASQFELLAALVHEPVQWSRVTVFHLDEYLGLDDHHPASFRKYLRERFAAQVIGLGAFHWVQGDAADPAAECARLGALIQRHPIDVACVGIGENGHLAFNDPPADLVTTTPYLIVQLDDACRHQQLGEGWFPTLADVPSRAISMSVQQILRSRQIICTVPDARKAVAVRATLRGPLTPQVPASMLTTHRACTFYLDPPAASLL